MRFQPSQIQMLPSNSKLLSWETYDEDVSSLAESSRITASRLLEQIDATRDTSDYLWYITRSVDYPLDLKIPSYWLSLVKVNFFAV
jgi:DNA polymerase III psi subunit